MKRIDTRLTQLEAKARKPEKVKILMSFDDPGYVTDDDGNRMTLEEYEACYPDNQLIIMTWGDWGDNEGDDD